MDEFFTEDNQYDNAGEADNFQTNQQHDAPHQANGYEQEISIGY